MFAKWYEFTPFRMAVEELNREVVKAKARVEVFQSTNIPVCPLKRTNKRFLNNTLRNALTFNKRKGHTTRLKSMKKLVEVDNPSSHPSTTSSSKRSPPPPTREEDDEVIVLD